MSVEIELNQSKLKEKFVSSVLSKFLAKDETLLYNQNLLYNFTIFD